MLNIEAILLVNSTIILDDMGDLATISLEELGRPVTDITKALDREGLARDAQLIIICLIDKALCVQQLTDAVVDTESCRFSTAGDTSLSDELTSAASFEIDVLLTLDVLVGVLDPSHHLLARAHVWTEAVDTGADKALLDELHGVPSRDSLELSLR